MRKAVQKQIGGLKTLTLEGKVGGSCIVLFHGYGADASDLIPLSDMLGLGEGVTWVFPEGPMEVIIAPGSHGKAWFQIDVSRLEKSMLSGEPVDMSQTTPSGIERARKNATLMYDEVLKKHSRIILGGFSQGAMLATDLSLNHKVKPEALLVMSGTLICSDRWRSELKSCEGLDFIQSHGKNDVILGYEYAENLYQFLTDGGMNGEFIGFSGGHEIPNKVIQSISQFLKHKLG
ncbi:MAG: esterase [Bdellovibrionales bacterium]